MSQYRMVYSKTFHLPLELENKAYWALKQLNMDMQAAVEQQKLQLYELEELRLFSYENARIYKEKRKQWHDQRIQQRTLVLGTLVLLYNSKLKLFLGKLKSRWSGPFELVRIYPHGAVDLLDENTSQEFKVSGHIVKYDMYSAMDHSKEDLVLRDPTFWAIKEGQAERPKIKR